MSNDGDKEADSGRDVSLPSGAPGANSRFRIKLDELERKVLIALAVSGEPESFADLAAATGVPPERLHSVLGRLMGHGLVTEVLDVFSEAVSSPLGEELPGETDEIIEDTPGEAKAVAPEKGIPAELEALTAYLENLKNKNYYQMLGVPANATRREIREVYYELVSQFHPDSRPDCTDPRAREVLGEIFSLLTQAYETLHHKKRREKYDRSIPEFTGVSESEEEEALAALFEESRADLPVEKEADTKPLGWNFYLAAVEAFQAGDYQSADLNFKLAAGLDPDRPEYQEGLARTREIIVKTQLAELKQEAARLEEERRFEEAVVALVKAVELDPVDPELRYWLARIRFLKTMDRLRAEEDISWAVSLDPHHVEALLLMGRIQAWKGNTEAAVQTFKQVLKLVPGHPKAKQALALFEK